MQQSLGLVSLLVRDYGGAIAYCVGMIGSTIVDDTPVPEQRKRWVVVAPPGSQARLLLARAVGPEQESRIGNQTGGRVFLFLYTDDFERDYRELKARGVTFARERKVEPYGIVAVFQDLHGNLWDLVELRSRGREAP